MDNVSRIVNVHNKSIIRNKAPTPTKLCNCRIPHDCPLDGNCQSKSVIYKATVNSNYDTNEHIGLCETTFKSRFINHKSSSFNHEHIRAETALTKHIWNLKDNKIECNTKWTILKRCHPYANVTKRCQLCLWKNTSLSLLTNQLH